jgi:hypothetical protein
MEEVYKRPLEQQYHRFVVRRKSGSSKIVLVENSFDDVKFSMNPTLSFEFSMKRFSDEVYFRRKCLTVQYRNELQELDRGTGSARFVAHIVLQ